MSTESHDKHSKPSESLGLPGTMPRPINVVMMGAGSFFTSSVLKDVILIPGSAGGELRLVDIDAERLELSRRLVEMIAARVPTQGEWKVKASTDRRELLPGADYIINAIEVSGLDCVRHDNDIPLEFGISQCIGDTIGPGGLFKALRTVPVWFDILRDAEELCPNAVALNYTNPMNMMCLAASRTSRIQHVGLCHSVQGTSRMLAGFADVPYQELDWECAGINHLAWFTRLARRSGENLYPKLFEMARDPTSKFATDEPVRTNMMLHFGAFITESSGHLSEYLPYYRKRRELIDKYTDTGYRGEESFYANNWPTWRAAMDANRTKLLSGEDELKLDRTFEYGSWIIEAMEKDVPYVIHGNVANHGLISNLPEDGCVEVACLVDRHGIQPTVYGRLPKQMAAICDSNMRMFDLGADAAIAKSIQLAEHALMLDPLTSAVCSPAEIRELCRRLFEAEAQYLPGFA